MVSPCLFVMIFLSMIMTLVSIFFDVRIFVVEFGITVVTLIWAAYGFWSFKNYIRSNVQSALANLDYKDSNSLDRLSVPAVMVGASGEILFFNSYFFSKISGEYDCTGEMVTQFLSDKSLDEVLNHKGIDVLHAGRRYTVFGARYEKTSLVCFLDDTYYKESTREYIESRPDVGIILFDNKEELLRDATDEQISQICAAVEREIQKWVEGTSGFMKSIGNNRYMVIFEDRHVKAFIEEKFKILDTIREIKIDDRRRATISIGLGRGAENLRESELWARKALDMALGRGGDQVAIKTGDAYSFFGGKSRVVEKLGKVRTRVISSTLSNYIKSSDRILIMGHKFSDLDSIGAAIGMWSASTKQLGKDAYIVVDKEQSLGKPIIEMMTENGFRNIFLTPSQARDLVSEKTLLIIVDTHSAGFIESKEIYDMCKNIVVIDHHRMMVDHIKNAIVFYHEPSASSASEMVTEILQYLGDKSLGSLEAEALLSGIMLDTKNFVQKTGVRTFEAAAFLKQKGADTIRVKKMFSNSLETYKIKSELISTVEIFKTCALTSIESDYKDIKIACAQAADELLEIQGVKASFVFYKSSNVVSISARSMGEVNVQVIMEKFGGGGHQTMAGAQIKDKSLESIKSLLKEKIDEIF